MKMYDYLAMGKPIVTTPIPPATSVSKYIYIANDKYNFVEKLKIATLENNEMIVQKRKEYIRNNSWFFKAKTIISNIEGVGL